MMREIISQNSTDEDGAVPLSVYNRELDIHVQKFVASLGGCERIQKTPIPTCFTRHTSRLIFMWSTLLPFAIYPVCGPFFTFPSTQLPTQYWVLRILESRSRSRSTSYLFASTLMVFTTVSISSDRPAHSPQIRILDVLI